MTTTTGFVCDVTDKDGTGVRVHPEVANRVRIYTCADVLECLKCCSIVPGTYMDHKMEMQGVVCCSGVVA